MWARPPGFRAQENARSIRAAILSISRFQKALFVPAAHFRARGLSAMSLAPNEGRAERRKAPGCSGTRRHISGCAGTLARRPTSPCDRGRAPCGAPPGDFLMPVRASMPRHFLRAYAASSLRPGRSARRSGSAPPETCGASASRGNASLAPPSGSPPETAPHEQGWTGLVSDLHIKVKLTLRYASACRCWHAGTPP